jgi:hypothetical protein
MNAATSHRSLLSVLFYVFETLFAASAGAMFFVDWREGGAWEEAVGAAYLFSFVGLFVVSFRLRRVSRRLANVGWLTLFIGFWSMVLVPTL